MLYQIDPQQTASFTQPEIATDVDLMTAIQGGNENALSELHRRHLPLLRTIIGKVLHVDADVDDVLQDVLRETWNRCKDFDSAKGQPLGWLVTMARRRAIDRVRRRQAYDRAEEGLRLATEQSCQTMHTHVEEDVMNADRAEMMQQLMNTLPEAQRTAVHLAYYRGLSQREIAAHLNIPLGTIKTRLELGLRKLKQALCTMKSEELMFS